MNIEFVRESLGRRLRRGLAFEERRPGKYQLIVPIRHEDGDMLDIFLVDSPNGENWVRVCDLGLTLMRLSYTYDINTPTRERIFESILINNGVSDDDGNLYLDARIDALYEGVLQFAGCVQKVCNLRFWSRENARSAFYDDLKAYVTEDLGQFAPVANIAPIPGYAAANVDWMLRHDERIFYLFGIRGNSKARLAAIVLLECQKAQLAFISLVVHEEMDGLGRNERNFLTNNADHQYPTLAEFRDRGVGDIARFARIR